jgi:hypothetical protein
VRTRRGGIYGDVDLIDGDGWRKRRRGGGGVVEAGGKRRDGLRWMWSDRENGETDEINQIARGDGEKRSIRGMMSVGRGVVRSWRCGGGRSGVRSRYGDTCRSWLLGWLALGTLADGRPGQVSAGGTAQVWDVFLEYNNR